jgi:two-component system LytT family response regulator
METMLRAVVIEDQPEIREANKFLLNNNFPDIEIVGEADNVEEGIEVLKKQKPDLVLLDVEIKGGTGFNILQKVLPYNFMVIFITGYDTFAIKAIKFSALDYILKPINEVEFVQAIEEAIVTYERRSVELQVENLLEQVDHKEISKKLVLRTQESIFLVQIRDILYCESDNSYTTFYLSDGRHILVSKSLKEYECMLVEYNFFRAHHRYLVNLNKMQRFDKADGGIIILDGGATLPVSSRRKQALFEALERK